MNEPRVLAVCLTANRTAMTRRAVASFKAQTYKNACMLVWDTGELSDDFQDETEPVVSHAAAEVDREGITVGTLRNEALRFWTEWDIAVHFDSDDWSHPNRIAEQVALLQSSGAYCVGYSEVLFCRDAQWSSPAPNSDATEDEAWIWRGSNPLAPHGASLCYWRAAWQRQPFADMHVGEDRDFLRRLGDKVVSVSSFATKSLTEQLIGIPQPRLICSLHGGNTSARVDESSRDWRRARDLDDYARGVMRL